MVLSEYGHNLPITISDRNFEQVKEFIKKMYVEKNGNEDGFVIPYEHFDFARDKC